MSRVYDNWERLVEATLKREQLRKIALCPSFSSSFSSDYSSLFSPDSTFQDLSASRDASETIDSWSSSRASLSYCIARPIKFKELKKATQKFGPYWWLGQGGFSLVYKGWIEEKTLVAAKPGSGMAIAVKMLPPEKFRDNQEWLAKVNYLSRFHHPNVVRLIGYCSEEEKRLLVYEFMPRGSLENHLFRRGYQSLEWNTRIKIATDVARALSFLHGMENQVIYRGLRTCDILLDREFNAKLSGVALTWGDPVGDLTHASAPLTGCYGYSAPEYITTGRFTLKCDVYSFGAVLLELLSGHRFIDKEKDSEEQNRVEWSHLYLSEHRKFSRMMDPKLNGQYPLDEAVAVSELALQCLSTEPERRPSTSEALVVLEHF